MTCGLPERRVDPLVPGRILVITGVVLRTLGRGARSQRSYRCEDEIARENWRNPVEELRPGVTVAVHDYSWSKGKNIVQQIRKIEVFWILVCRMRNVDVRKRIASRNRVYSPSVIFG
jgi:hypothetical protein